MCEEHHNILAKVGYAKMFRRTLLHPFQLVTLQTLDGECQKDDRISELNAEIERLKVQLLRDQFSKKKTSE